MLKALGFWLLLFGFLFAGNDVYREHERPARTPAASPDSSDDRLRTMEGGTPIPPFEH